LIQFTNTIHIDRPDHEVFAYLADLEHTPEWNWAIEATEKLDDGPIGVGSEYRQRRSVPSRTTEQLTITALEPPLLLGVEGTLGPFPARLSYRLEDQGGGTRLTNTVELDPPLALRLASPIMSRRIESSVADNLGELKRILES